MTERIDSLKGVGPRTIEKLNRCGINRIDDLLFHLPLRYQDQTRVIPIGDLTPGDKSLVQGIIIKTYPQFGRGRGLVCQIEDESGELNLRFFNIYPNQRAMLVEGAEIRCFGEVKKLKKLEMMHPEYKIIEPSQEVPMAEHYTAIYPTTEGLNQATFRKLIPQSFQLTKLQELLPEAVLSDMQYPNLHDALRLVHQPTPEISLSEISSGTHKAQQRLAFEELLAHCLSVRKLSATAVREHAKPLPIKDELQQQFKQALPFKLTQAQVKAVSTITKSMADSTPMMSLLQGDVGSGKTIVAAFAALQAVAANRQVVIMAPTEILAEQHLLKFSEWFESFNIPIAFLTGKVKGTKRKQLLVEIASGEARVIIGTHAVFQDQVEFWDIGLTIIDEQHRFGVEQRLSLRSKGNKDGLYPHQLFMTATPIPRTLAMTLYTDFKVIVIDELPPGRTPVKTVAISDEKREQVIERIRKACVEGKQAYWVCTLIDESDTLQCQAAETTAQTLSQRLPELKIGLVHGRMDADSKQQVISDFKNKKLDLIVATTVIEVGVDVPNASLMIIENPERLGLSQLHQLRGRVGRGDVESHCVLLYKSPLSEQGHQRLEILRQTNDGFLISEKDLEMRGPGDMAGVRQSGILQLKIANFIRDKHLLEQVQATATQLLSQYPHTVDALLERWLPEAQEFSVV